MAVGALVTEELEDDPELRDASPYLVWEWLVVESFFRTKDDDSHHWGVPGAHVTRRALDQPGYLDARSYLKTPRIFGFHGVYKRLAIHLGIIDVHLGPGPNAGRLVDAWARGLGLSKLAARDLRSRWTDGVRRSLREKPPRAKPRWKTEEWEQLARASAPSGCRLRERHCLRDLLVAADDRRLGALPTLWELQAEFDDDGIEEELLHNELEARAPEYGPLLGAIRAYEAFVRSLQDGFDLLRAEAAETLSALVDSREYWRRGFRFRRRSQRAPFLARLSSPRPRTVGGENSHPKVQNVRADSSAVSGRPGRRPGCSPRRGV
jgi:hypothetical protein